LGGVGSVIAGGEQQRTLQPAKFAEPKFVELTLGGGGEKPLFFNMQAEFWVLIGWNSGCLACLSCGRGKTAGD